MKTKKQISALINQFFVDCERDNRSPNDRNLDAWLWFTCPAQMREQVGAGIIADQRFKKERKGNE